MCTGCSTHQNWMQPPAHSDHPLRQRGTQPQSPLCPRYSHIKQIRLFLQLENLLLHVLYRIPSGVFDGGNGCLQLQSGCLRLRRFIVPGTTGATRLRHSLGDPIVILSVHPVHALTVLRRSFTSHHTPSHALSPGHAHPHHRPTADHLLILDQRHLAL